MEGSQEVARLDVRNARCMCNVLAVAALPSGSRRQRTRESAAAEFMRMAHREHPSKCDTARVTEHEIFLSTDSSQV